jgi:hypothetical protein
VIKKTIDISLGVAQHVITAVAIDRFIGGHGGKQARTCRRYARSPNAAAERILPKDEEAAVLYLLVMHERTLNRFAHDRQRCRTHACNAGAAFHNEVKACVRTAITCRLALRKRGGLSRGARAASHTFTRGLPGLDPSRVVWLVGSSGSGCLPAPANA